MEWGGSLYHWWSCTVELLAQKHPKECWTIYRNHILLNKSLNRKWLEAGKASAELFLHASLWFCFFFFFNFHGFRLAFSAPNYDGKNPKLSYKIHHTERKFPIHAFHKSHLSQIINVWNLSWAFAYSSVEGLSWWTFGLSQDDHFHAVTLQYRQLKDKKAPGEVQPAKPFKSAALLWEHLESQRKAIELLLIIAV